MDNRHEAVKEMIRRSEILLRHHLELQRAEKSLDSNFVDVLITVHPITVSQEVSEYPNFRIRKKIFKPTIRIEKIVRFIIESIISHMSNNGSPKRELSNYFTFINDDSDEAINNDFIISSLFIRNRAVLNIYGEDIAKETEKITIDIIEEIFGKSALFLYMRFIESWAKCIDDLMIPHLYISQILHKEICGRIGIDYSEKPLFEHSISDIILNIEVGVWLRTFYKTRLK